MYEIVFDSDGLLKVYKAGFLDVVTAEYACLLPEEVFRETVVAARRAHPDEAEAFEGLVRTGRLRRRPGARSARAERILGLSQTLGPGERGALRLYLRERADSIITDDRAFLNVLIRNRIPFLTPSELLIRLRIVGRLAHEEAHTSAERLRPYIRREVYQDLIERLGGFR